MSLYRTGCLRRTVAFCLGTCLATLLAAAPANPELALRVTSETAPAGGWAQIKVFATSPHLVASGSISMDFDSSVFGGIASVAVFSATGDALGYANVKGQHVDAHFSSASAGVGQLPDLPVFAVWIPLLPAAKLGASTAVTLDASGAAWTDEKGNSYAVTVSPGAITVGGGMSVATVTPGGGLLPAGTVLQIAGTGFDATTTLAIDGAAVGALRFINSQQMEATLGGATELSGKHFRLANAGGETVDYYSAFPSAPGAPPAGFNGPVGMHPLVPLPVFQEVVTDMNLLYHPASRRSLAMLNQTSTPVNVLRAPVSYQYGGVDSFTIPPGSLYFLYTGEGYQISTTAPVRMLEVLQIDQTGINQPNEVRVFTPAVANAPPSPLQMQLSQHAVSWSWQSGTALPAAASIDVSGNLGFTVAVSSAPWLTVTPAKGTAPASLSLKTNPAQLAPGVYAATVSVTPTLPDGFADYPVKSAEITVSLTVTSGPQLSSDDSSINLFQFVGAALAGKNTLSLVSNGQPVAFTVAASTSTGGPWLSVTPSSGTTPSTLTVTVNTTGLTGGSYTGDLAILGTGSILHVPVFLTIFPLPPPPTAGSVSVSPSAVVFSMPAGAAALQSGAQLINVFPIGTAFQATVQTANGQGWLTAETAGPGAPGPSVILANASAANLVPGTYKGSILVSTATLGSVQIPVTLTVFQTQTGPVVTPSALMLSAVAGQTASAQLTVTSAGDPVLFNAGVSAPGNPGWLFALPSAPLPPLGLAATPGTVQVQVQATEPGDYQGEVLITWAKETIHVPVKFRVSAVPGAPAPLTTEILNAASQTPLRMAPGEIFTVFGLGIGPAPTGLQLDPAGSVATTLAGAQVTVNDVPAPLVYASPGQLNAIVPYEAGTSGLARVRVNLLGQTSGAWDVPLAGAAPGIFTVGSTGVGQGAVLNQDSSVNGPQNPAVRGSVIQLFATGEGLTNPPGRTGTITGTSGGAPNLQVKVTIGGVDAPLQFAGSAPESVAGLFQVNAVVPPGAPVGSAVPIMLSVGGVPSQAGVTIALR